VVIVALRHSGENDHARHHAVSILVGLKVAVCCVELNVTRQCVGVPALFEGAAALRQRRRPDLVPIGPLSTPDLPDARIPGVVCNESGAVQVMVPWAVRSARGSRWCSSAWPSVCRGNAT